MGGFHGGHGSGGFGFHGGGHISSGGSSGSSSGGSSGSGSSGDFFDWIEIFGYSLYIIIYSTVMFRYKVKLILSGVAFVCLVLILGFGVGFDAYVTITDIQKSEQIVDTTNFMLSYVDTYEYKETYTYEYTYYGKTYTFYEENIQKYIKPKNQSIVIMGYQTAPKETNVHVGDSEKIFVQLFNPSNIKSGERIGFKLLAGFLSVLILVYVISSIMEISEKKL